MTYLILFLQLISVLLSCTGIYIEYIYKADLGFLFITAGALLFGLFTKVRELQLTYENINLKKKGHL